TTTETIAVTNVAPTASVTGPSGGVPGQPRTFTFLATDPSPIDQAAGFIFAIKWGDAANQTVTGASGLKLDHIYTATGTFTVQVTATDDDGAVGPVFSKSVTITTVKLESAIVNPALTDLAVGGNAAGGDTITVSATDTTGKVVNVTINKTSL